MVTGSHSFCDKYDEHMETGQGYRMRMAIQELENGVRRSWPAQRAKTRIRLRDFMARFLRYYSLFLRARIMLAAQEGSLGPSKGNTRREGAKWPQDLAGSE
jgi:hypothetical protein